MIFFILHHFKFLPLKSKALYSVGRVFLLILYIILNLTFTACERIPDGVVDTRTVDYKVVKVEAPAIVIYSTTDSLVATSIQFIRTESIAKVWLSVKSIDGKQTVFTQIEMADDGNTPKNSDQKKGDGIFSAKFGMSKKYSSVKYMIEYFAEDNIQRSPDNVSKIAEHIFLFDNQQKNLPPIISNLLIPQSVNRGDIFIFSVKAEDPNGLNDILQVYFKLFRPDGTQVKPSESQDFFLMDDTGSKDIYGDEKGGDGIYSFKNSFGTTSQIGIWRFEFQAKDRAGNLSNKLIHNMNVD